MIKSAFTVHRWQSFAPVASIRTAVSVLIACCLLLEAISAEIEFDPHPLSEVVIVEPASGSRQRLPDPDRYPNVTIDISVKFRIRFPVAQEQACCRQVVAHMTLVSLDNPFPYPHMWPVPGDPPSWIPKDSFPMTGGYLLSGPW